MSERKVELYKNNVFAEKNIILSHRESREENDESI